MSSIHGLDHFVEYFKEYSSHYVIIGGIATNYFLVENDLYGRQTKDIDLVVLANPNKAFADRLREYVTIGQYQSMNADSCNYRFRSPLEPAFPKQIEIFSTLPMSLDLKDKQKIVPFKTSEGIKSLSAILMDEDYFNLVKSACVIKNGLPLLSSNGLIPLKMRAFLDLYQKRQDGEQVDSQNIKKHRNDVLRLTQTLDEEIFTLPDSIKKDCKAFVEHDEIKSIDIGTLSTIVTGFNSMSQLLHIIEEHFDLDRH